MALNPYLPQPARILKRRQESDTVFTLRLRFEDVGLRARYRFAPGQFNMVYLLGVGEVPISIVSDPELDGVFDHTIRCVGRVTEGLASLHEGECVGIRGPYGRGWPLSEAQGRDLLVITGGLGCAPVVSVIHYAIRHRRRFGKLTIIQGVKHSDDMIYRDQYQAWSQVPNTEVHVAANAVRGAWPWHVGPVTELIAQAEPDPERTVVMMCGPEGMMLAAARMLMDKGLPDTALFLSLERNMQCGIGHCGHCQIGGQFVCRDGPVFNFAQVRSWFGVRGF
ncbi:FAD/NAD(P)-binding protein [Thiobacter aerophilum]|uniref:FAD/NAD(P)-binding protein n=1 Tax=Thiobacter aerophilum TaxID=3121275 RepID=A0ABV0EDJ4_9BURK